MTRPWDGLAALMWGALASGSEHIAPLALLDMDMLH